LAFYLERQFDSFDVWRARLGKLHGHPLLVRIQIVQAIQTTLCVGLFWYFQTLIGLSRNSSLTIHFESRKSVQRTRNAPVFQSEICHFASTSHRLLSSRKVLERYQVHKLRVVKLRQRAQISNIYLFGLQVCSNLIKLYIHIIEELFELLFMKGLVFG
jgi:hypothetical protein